LTYQIWPSSKLSHSRLCGFYESRKDVDQYPRVNKNPSTHMAIFEIGAHGFISSDFIVEFRHNALHMCQQHSTVSFLGGYHICLDARQRKSVGNRKTLVSWRMKYYTPVASFIAPLSHAMSGHSRLREPSFPYHPDLTLTPKSWPAPVQTRR